MRIFSSLFLISTASAFKRKTPETNHENAKFEIEPRFVGTELFSYPNKLMRSIEKCCRDPNYISCSEISLNFDSFDPETLNRISVDGIELEFERRVPPNGFVYMSKKGDEAMFSYNKETGHLFGDISSHDGRTLEIESCHNSHVIKEVDVGHLKNDYVTVPESVLANVSSRAAYNWDGDTSTQVSFSVMFYYTEEFEAITADIEGFINQIMDLTNEGFRKSNIPIQVELFCIEKATLTDAEADYDLEAFRNMKGSPSATLNSADAATMLVAHSDHYCGVAYLHPAYADWVFSYNVKSCVANYVVGHELGHNFGCHHDRESTGGQNWVDDAGFGHYIEPGNGRGGARTIMAYRKTGYSQRANQYSNPEVIYSWTGTPTGTDNETNNAALIMKNRKAMADNGDESGVCQSRPTTSTTTATTTTATTSTSTTTTKPTSTTTTTTTSTTTTAPGRLKF